jgi:hypothetical protein
MDAMNDDLACATVSSWWICYLRVQQYYNSGTICTLPIAMNFPIPAVERIGIVAWRCSRAHATRNCASPIPVWCWALIRETRQGRDHREEHLCVCVRGGKEQHSHCNIRFRPRLLCPLAAPSPMPPFLTHRRSKAPGDKREIDNDKPF